MVQAVAAGGTNRRRCRSEVTTDIAGSQDASLVRDSGTDLCGNHHIGGIFILWRNSDGHRWRYATAGESGVADTVDRTGDSERAAVAIASADRDSGRLQSAVGHQSSAVLAGGRWHSRDVAGANQWFRFMVAGDISRHSVGRRALSCRRALPRVFQGISIAARTESDRMETGNTASTMANRSAGDHALAGQFDATVVDLQKLARRRGSTTGNDVDDTDGTARGITGMDRNAAAGVWSPDSRKKIQGTGSVIFQDDATVDAGDDNGSDILQSDRLVDRNSQ